MKFVIDQGSDFSRHLADYLRRLNVDVITWRKAERKRWDLVIAAHANANLGHLDGPVVLVPHGAGYSRRVPESTGDDNAPAGLARLQLTMKGEVFPAAIGLSHEDQIGQLRDSCPEAVNRAFVMGDPTFDRLHANRHRRDQFRKVLNVDERRLVVVTTTWGRHSSLAEQENLALRLVAQLPLDEWQVALVLHPNVWFGSSSGWELENNVLNDALDGGLIVIPPENGWQAALLAADVIVGDHGSTAFYGAALGRPFLLSATGLTELAPSSPRIQLSQASDQLNIDENLRTQIESVILRHDPAKITAITDRTLGRQGESLTLLRNKFYELLKLEPPEQAPRLRPLLDPEPIQRPRPTAYLIAAKTQEIDEKSGIVTLERFPAVVSEYRGQEEPLDLFELIEDTEVDFRHRESAEIVIRVDRYKGQNAHEWAQNIYYECAGAKLVTIDIGSRCLAYWNNGNMFEVTVVPITGADPAAPNPLVGAAAIYAWKAAGFIMPTADFTLHVRMGATESTVKITPKSDIWAAKQRHDMSD